MRPIEIGGGVLEPAVIDLLGAIKTGVESLRPGVMAQEPEIICESLLELSLQRVVVRRSAVALAGLDSLSPAELVEKWTARVYGTRSHARKVKIEVGNAMDSLIPDISNISRQCRCDLMLNAEIPVFCEGKFQTWFDIEHPDSIRKLETPIGVGCGKYRRGRSGR